MNPLPIESSDWLADFRDRIALERSIFQSLIQWGLTESVSDIYRMLEERFNDALVASVSSGPPVFNALREDQAQIADVLRDTYLKVRHIPRRRSSQEQLHNAVLTGCADLTEQLVRCYDDYVNRRNRQTIDRSAA